MDQEITTLSGKKELIDSFNKWSAGLSTYSIQAAYAIIAANWAAHSETKTILTNEFSLWSIITCVGLITINILLVGIITELQKHRWNKAENNHKWWESEYTRRDDTRWPYTNLIEGLGVLIRYIKILLPIFAGSFFIVSLF